MAHSINDTIRGRKRGSEGVGVWVTNTPVMSGFPELASSGQLTPPRPLPRFTMLSFTRKQPKTGLHSNHRSLPTIMTLESCGTDVGKRENVDSVKRTQSFLFDTPGIVYDPHRTGPHGRREAHHLPGPTPSRRCRLAMRCGEREA